MLSFPAPLHSPPSRAPNTPHRQSLPRRQKSNAARLQRLWPRQHARRATRCPGWGMAVPYGRTLAGSGRESKTRESTLSSEPLLLNLSDKWLVGKPMSPGNRIFPVFHLDNGEDHIPWEIRAVLLQVLGTSSLKHVSEIRRNCFNKLLR